MSLLPEGRFVAPGSIVEFMHGNQPQLAFVIDEQGGKLRLYTINKRETKMPATRLLPWVGPKYGADITRQEMLDLLVSHQEKRGEYQASLNVMELWELAQGELEKAPLEWFAGLLWEEPDPDMISALGRAMIAAKTHFKFQPPQFLIYTAEKVEQRLVQQREEKEREEIINTGQELFKAIWAARTSGGRLDKSRIPEMSPGTQERLYNFLKQRIAGNEDETSNKIWSTLRKGLPDHPHLPLLLAQGWGVVGPHYNFLFDEAGYCRDDSWSEAYLDETERIINSLKEEEQTPLPLNFRSIDSASTKDIDDAFVISRREDGGYTLTIALARPSLNWDFESELSNEVAARSTSIYLPEGTSHMLPESLGIGAFSLFENEIRPALVTTFEISATGETESVTPSVSWVKLAENTTYEAVEKLLDAENDEELSTAFELAEKLLDKRIKNGAVVIRRPEPELSLEGWPDNVKVNLGSKEDTSKADLIISEFMILINSGLGQYAQDNNFSLLYRTQDIALPSDSSGIVTEPQDIYSRVRLMIPPTLETSPKKHATLAVLGYSPISSPLRRYADFLNMTQLCHFLNNGTARWDEEQMTELGTSLQIRTQAVSKIQRFRPRYWKLLYILQNKKQWYYSVMVDENGPLATLAMPDIQINVRTPKNMLGDKLYPGQRFMIRFNKVDPLTNELRVAEAMEE
jgi:exoribonuclease-2